ncbi:hypothetical protein BSG1_14193 [Bacillus sp. SG-1]|nr:hypothetical protein BSG1_14193 [Bacillus sp. SG-1]
MEHWPDGAEQGACAFVLFTDEELFVNLIQGEEY